jgi:hypothetical protein
MSHQLKYIEALKEYDLLCPKTGRLLPLKHEPCWCPDCGQRLLDHPSRPDWCQVGSKIVEPLKLAEKQKDLEPEFSKSVDKHFWDLI